MTGMTNTDPITPEAEDAHPGTPGPSSLYDNATTYSEIDVTYKENFPHGADAATISAYREDHRRAHVRRVGKFPGAKSSTPRREAAPVVLQPEEDNSGHLVITCAGACGETKPAKKFPTRSGNRPGREGVCRSCRDAAIAEAKSKAAGR
jgi:hypothetical protein